MENESNKNRRGTMAIGVITGFAIGALLGVIGGILIKGTAIWWLLIGIGVGIIIGISISGWFGSRKKKE
jgi:uncharacterized membrane protein YoaK (UPF0700 family)